MKLPKRIPWSNPSELEQISSWIYEDENDIAAKVLAVNRVSLFNSQIAFSTAYLITAGSLESFDTITSRTRVYSVPSYGYLGR